MLSLNSLYAIGIDFTGQDIYAVQLREIREGITIRTMVHQVLSQEHTDVLESSDTFVSALKAVVGNNLFRGKRVLIHIPSQYVNTFPISFEIRDESLVEEAIVREMRGYLSFPVEDAIIDYPSLYEVSAGGATKKYKANIIAVQRDKIERYLHILKQAGLSVEAVDFGLASLIRLHRYLYPLTENSAILCNMGNRESLLTVVTKNSILTHRNVAWGIQPLLNRLKANLELSADNGQATDLLKKYGLFYEDFQGSLADPREDDANSISNIDIYRAIFQILSPYIDDFINEFHQIIGYVRSEAQQTAFEGIFMYGQANIIRHLAQYIEKRLNIPSKCVNPMTKLIPSDNGLQPHMPDCGPFSLALGLAMRRVKWL